MEEAEDEDDAEKGSKWRWDGMRVIEKGWMERAKSRDRCAFRCLRYLRIPARLLVVDVVEPVEAVADAVLGQILVAVRPALRLDAGNVADVAQIDYELLIEVGLLGGPRRATFVFWGGNEEAK